MAKIEVKAPRRVYNKPQLERVHLIAEEAVLTVCKTSTGGGPYGQGQAPFCKNPGGQNCFEDGS